MKRKDKEQLHGASKEELVIQLSEVVKKITELTAGRVKQQSRNTREALLLRKKRAVILTILREKELSV